MRLYKTIVNGLFIISLIIIIWINFFKSLYITTTVLIDIVNLNRLIETVAIAYLTSYIFYLTIYVLKSKQDKKIILPFVADYVYVALNNCNTFCYSLRSQAYLEYIEPNTSIHKRDLSIYPNSAELKIICSMINPNKAIYSENELIDFTTIPQYFGVMIKHIHKIDYFIKIVLDKSIYIDTELLRLLTDIQTHGFHQDMMSYEKNMIMSASHRNDNLVIYEKSLESYFEIYIKLEKYSEVHLKKYVERESLKSKVS